MVCGITGRETVSYRSRWTVLLEAFCELTCLWFGCTPDEDVRKYRERLQRDSEHPVQVDEVDSCYPRTLERVGLTLDDDPEGQHLFNFFFKVAVGLFGNNSSTVMLTVIKKINIENM